MTGKNHSQKDGDRKEKRGLLNNLFSGKRKDETFLPDLKQDWAEMDPKKRRQFLFGIAAGVVILVILIVLVGLFIFTLRGG
jgi:hypothetical protein